MQYSRSECARPAYVAHRDRIQQKRERVRQLLHDFETAAADNQFLAAAVCKPVDKDEDNGQISQNGQNGQSGQSGDKIINVAIGCRPRRVPSTSRKKTEKIVVH